MTEPAQDHPLLVELVFRIQTYDIDFAGVVCNIVYIRWLEDLRLKMLEEYFPLERVLAEGFIPILARTEIDYLVPLRIGDRPVGQMWVAETGRARIDLQAEFRLGERVVARARQRGYFLDSQTMRTRPLPGPLRLSLGEPATPAEPTKRVL